MTGHSRIACRLYTVQYKYTVRTLITDGDRGTVQGSLLREAEYKGHPREAQCPSNLWTLTGGHSSLVDPGGRASTLAPLVDPCGRASTLAPLLDPGLRASTLALLVDPGTTIMALAVVPTPFLPYP